MQKAVLKYVKGLSPDANAWEKKNHKKYGSLQSTCRQIEYDLKHGVLMEEVMASINKIHNHSSFRTLRQDGASMNRLSDIEKYFTAPKAVQRLW